MRIRGFFIQHEIMKIQLATFENLPQIIEIIEEAKIHLASLHIDQWQNGYPNAEQIEKDIKNNESYVVLNADNQMVATAMFTTNKESTYNEIEGDWEISVNKTYGVVHRMAIKKKFLQRGLATAILEEFHKQLKHRNIQSLKIDTHEDNLGMQALLKKLDYKYCGIIHTDYGAKRLAYEKVILI
jgi:ribosomal protein S18 acetylase RimI-like enzyme